MQPSVSVLKKILDGIPVDLGRFFSFELAQEQARVFRCDDHLNIGAQGVRYLLVATQRSDHALQMLHEFYDPGRRALSHDGEECHAGGDHPRGGACPSRQGRVLLYSRTPHRFRNIGSKICGGVVSACTLPAF